MKHKFRPVALILGMLGLLVGAAAVFALREATLSTHQPVAEGSRTRLVLEAETEDGEARQSVDEMVEAVLLACRLEVTSDLVAPVAAQGDGIFAAVLAPALDQTNERQLRGCLEDWTIDHLLVDVISVEHL